MSPYRTIFSTFVAITISFGVISTASADKTEALQQWIKNNANAQKYTPEQVMAMPAPGPNPWLSQQPAGAVTDWNYWNMKRKMDSAAKMPQMRAVINANQTTSNNASTQQTNNTSQNVFVGSSTAKFKVKKDGTHVIKGFGTKGNKQRTVVLNVVNNLLPVLPITPNAEDEGSIPLATPTLIAGGTAIQTSGTIGDGLFGSTGTGSGDVDFFKIANVKAGQEIFVDINTPDALADLDSFIVIYNTAGDVIDFNDDGNTLSLDSLLTTIAPADGDYFVSVTGFGTFALTDPTDSSSGSGAGSEGSYDILIGLDYFTELPLEFKLRKGDVFGASLFDLFGNLSLVDRNGVERQGSGRDATPNHPAASPLLGGNAALSHVVEKNGKFRLLVHTSNTGQYTVVLSLFTSPLRSALPGSVQTIFIDFDGATIDAQALFGGIIAGDRVISPLADFLPRWGLGGADFNPVVDAILASLEESLVEDLDRRGREKRFDIQILNSRDHLDPATTGQANVSRIIIGGTIAELGISTIGIAQSIDVGNFDTTETAIVLLDLLSEIPADPNSLNGYTLAPGVSIINLIGTAVGNVTAHEAGHFLGDWHTNQFNSSANIMDQGGNPANMIGVGPDNIFGSADDVDVDFGRDTFVPNEGFTGTEDTLNTIAFGNSTPKRRRNSNSGPEPGFR